MTILLCTVEVFCINCYDNISSHAFEYPSFFTFTTLSSRASNRVHVTIVNICKRHYSMSIIIHRGERRGFPQLPTSQFPPPPPQNIIRPILSNNYISF